MPWYEHTAHIVPWYACRYVCYLLLRPFPPYTTAAQRSLLSTGPGVPAGAVFTPAAAHSTAGPACIRSRRPARRLFPAVYDDRKPANLTRPFSGRPGRGGGGGGGGLLTVPAAAAARAGRQVTLRSTLLTADRRHRVASLVTTTGGGGAAADVRA